MKNFLFWAICFFLLCGMLIGCTSKSSDSEKNSNVSVSQSSDEKDIPVIKVLIDLAMGGDTHAACEEMKHFFENNVDGCGDDFLIEVEALPSISDPEKRNPTVMGMHMELQTGGADVFLVRNFSNGLGVFTDLKNFFPYPTSAIKQRLFLPLDEFISDDPNWDNLSSVVMDAGKQNGSQQIVPLSYSMKVSLVGTDKYSVTENLPLTCYQMLDSDDPILRYSAINGLDLLGVLAQYDKEELTFSEDDLLTLVQKMNEAKQTVSIEEMYSLGLMENATVGPINDAVLSYDENTNYWMIPSYNRDGGVTAHIETYAAVNRNTRYPEEAYAVIQSLVSLEGQSNGLVTCLKMPVYMGLGREDSMAASGWFLDEWELNQVEAIQCQINAVEFITPLSTEVEALFHECSHIDDETLLKNTVHDSYTRMRMMLAES